MDFPEVAAGQVWRERSPRRQKREIRVVGVTPEKVVLEGITNEKGLVVKSRRTTMDRGRFTRVFVWVSGE